jgi:hypothetical protein
VGTEGLLGLIKPGPPIFRSNPPLKVISGVIKETSLKGLVSNPLEVTSHLKGFKPWPPLYPKPISLTDNGLWLCHKPQRVLVASLWHSHKLGLNPFFKGVAFNVATEK